MKSHADLIDKSEVARILGGELTPVSISFVNQLLARKKLPRVRLSYKVVRIPRQAVEDFILSRTIAQKGAH